MKILSVRFQNLNSLKGEHEIRFDQSPLAEAGLFAITGQTGAGKTTILDAITVGLYGLVHRHSNDKPLELMTRHTAESFSEVEFEANGKRYRSKWHIRRSRGKADGNIQPVHMELYSFEKDSLFDLKPSEVSGKVAELCGLDYNQFLRSVMLSQGDFARFLKANANERSSLLEKITDTGIYSQISKFAFEKAKEERQKREELERKLQDTELLPEEQRQAYKQSIAELSAQEESLKQQLGQLQQKLQWQQQQAQLQARTLQYQQELQQQEEKLASLQPEFSKLQLHEQAHQFVGELAEIKSTNSKVQEAHTELQTLQKRIPTLETELEAVGKIALEATKVHQQQEKALQQLEPLLAQVTQLDHQLTSTRESYSKNKQAYLNFAQQLQQEQEQLYTQQQHLEKLTQDATALKNWLSKNAKLQDLKEHLPEFRATLRDLQEVEQRSRGTLQELQQLQQQREQEAIQLNQVQQKQAQQQNEQALLRQQQTEQLEALRKLLADKSMEELEQEAQEQPALSAKYERLQETTRQHSMQQQKLQRSTTQLAQLQQQQNQLQAEVQQLNGQLAQAQEHLEALEKLVQLQQQVQQYEEARHTLSSGEPCPLCGATHHPFAENGYTFDLPQEVKKRDAQRVQVRAQEQHLNKQQLELGTVAQQLQLEQNTKADCEAEVQRLQQAFAQLRQGLPEELNIKDEERLAQLLQAQQQSATALQQRLGQARTLSRTLEGINQQQQKLREAQVQAQASFNQLQASDKLLQAQLQKLQVKLTDEQAQQHDHTQTATSFAATYGQVFRLEERQALQQLLEQQATTYSQKQQALDNMRDTYLNLKAEVKTLTANIEQKKQEQDKLQQALKEEHDILNTFKNKRQELFGEKDTEQERQKAQQQVKASAQQAEEARSSQTRKQQELQEARNRQHECQSRHRQHSSALEQLRDGLLHVLRQKGIETIEALSQMLLDRDEADRLANLKAHIEKHLTECRKSLRDAQQELQQLQAQSLTDESAEALQEQLQQQTNLHHELITKRARHQQLLEQDEEQLQKNRVLAAQLQQQQQVHQRWAQLSDLIGSAEGTKFSRFAQGLTLARLVELANRHLQQLNDRYRILKSDADDLELQIVDLYQAEAVRPMNTLSGGESFLVSLALALGLSDLAGRRTQINSLFIDEGFGTLDAETLDSAISTLENLQASGKMIGIISHVEALKERILTQIKVQRQPGGVSKVEVVG